MAGIMFMSGAIMGDFYGSPYEFHSNKNEEYVYNTILKGGEKSCQFTDDTILTFAIMKWLSSPRVDKLTLIKILKDFVRRYPSSYGTHFAQWALSGSIQPYNSCGNGSAMRVSPVGVYANSLEECLELAKLSAEVTHNHPEGIKGAQAVAAIVYLQNKGGWSIDKICKYITETFGYDLNRTYKDIKPTYKWDGTCQGCVPEAIIIWRDEPDYYRAIAKAIALGGDADTLACIVGSMYSSPREDTEREFPVKVLNTAYYLINPEFSEIATNFATSCINRTFDEAFRIMAKE